MRELSDMLANEGVVSGAYAAYAALVPFAYRADLWRACVIWANGGIYLDHKMRLTKHWSTWADVASGVLSICKDRVKPYSL